MSTGGAGHHLVLQSGGLGDLVLVSELIASLKQTWRDGRVTLVCRSEFTSVAQFYPAPPDAVIPLQFNPFGCFEPEPGLLAALDALLPVLRDANAGTVVAAGLRLTWLDWLVAATLAPPRAVACSATTRPGGLLPVLLNRFGIELAPVFESAGLPGTVHERDRYRSILRLLGAEPAGAFPWLLPEATRERTVARLARWGLEAGGYLVCCPFGTSGGELRQWPVERFVEALSTLRRNARRPIVVTGAAHERAGIEEFVSVLKGAGHDARGFAGEPPELPALLGLVALSRAYFGSDTGPMHVAAAYGVPGVTVYGGGTWQSYAPWGKGAIGVVQPMPCFGCFWDCMFDRFPCVRSIPVEPVARALADVLAAPPAEPQVRAIEMAEPAAALLPAAALQYRQSQRDREARLHSIVELSSALEDVRRNVEQYRGEAERRENAMKKLTAQMEERDRNGEERLRLLESAHRWADSLQREAELRLEHLQRADAAMGELRREIERRDNAIASLTREIRERERRTEAIEQDAADRLAALERVNAEAARIREIVAAQEKEIQQLRARLAHESGAAVSTD